ncbi:C4-dicarboxylate TRAP transporter substrate-binding protein [Psychromarinibacter halotolerans]|uniref:C4-dicarboxylate TRAP transporter substrate-binding protein n=1 Tax=Psychromarinibacter halotolerans TaxID=1775175 RepID=A0ABV7GZD4_9RHOB|nr:C4-dicarboxylate TRAP transporter substrate-binding protein [Psychromarinibacter halotolerans]MDF0597591.1 C4-dicarboxylate TRAP transporter substrate-binding protein [Psychromarinibacter halotolerans]
MTILNKATCLAVLLSGALAVGAQAETTIRIGTVLAPDDPMGQGLDKFAAEVADATGGEVNIEVFHNSQLGDTTEMLDQARAGAGVGTVTDVARLSEFVPSLAIMSAPFLFDTYEDADTFAQSDAYLGWGDELEEKAGLVMLASNWYQGPRHALTQMPVTGPADLDGVRMRTIGAPVWIETIRAMGAEPTPIAWGEVYSALQLGTIDAAEAQPTAIKGAKLYEVIKNVTKTGHIQLVTALVVSADAWNELSDEHKQIVRDLAVENGRYASGLTIELGEKALEDVAASGVTISEVDLAPFKEAVAPVYEMLNLTSEADMVREVLAK